MLISQIFRGITNIHSEIHSEMLYTLGGITYAKSEFQILSQ